MSSGRCSGYDGLMSAIKSPINPQTIIAAQVRINGDVRRTPLLRLPGAPLGVGCAELWLKLEHLQRGGTVNRTCAKSRAVRLLLR